jgi:hypothetical protein
MSFGTHLCGTEEVHFITDWPQRSVLGWYCNMTKHLKLLINKTMTKIIQIIFN